MIIINQYKKTLYHFWPYRPTVGRYKNKANVYIYYGVAYVSKMAFNDMTTFGTLKISSFHDAK